MASTEVMKNKPYDEAVDLSDDESEESVPDQPERSAMGAESNDFEFADEFSSQDQSPQKGAGAQVVQNQHFDEAVDLSDSESVDDTDSPSKSSAAARSPAPAPAPAPAPIPARQPPPQAQQSPPGTKSTADDSKDEDDDEEGDSDEDESGSSSSESEAGAMQGYNPADYAHLQVSSEVKDLFAYITRFTPTVIELDTKLKPFVPEYIPAVGEIDAFLKVHTLFAEVHSPQIPRPDGKPEPLGLSVLDEPGPVQTDPTVLDLELRSITRQTNLQPVTVAAIENAAQNPKAITDWIKSINDLHSKNPPPNVNYTKPMPDIDALMQVWPQELEEAMGELQLPTAELDVDITAYTRIICALLDIPVHTNLIESLHVLFTLYSEFKGNQHFNDASNGGLGGFGAPGMGGL